MEERKSIIALHMAENFEKLAPLLQHAHTGKLRLEGLAEVSRGNLVAKCICNFFRFPKAGSNVPLRVDCNHTSENMSWARDFDGLKMTSHFNREGKLLIEHLGPLSLGFKAVEKSTQLHYQFENTRFLGIPFPKILSPQITAFEKESEGNYVFFVEVRMFIIGKVISYYGTLKLTQEE